MSEPARWQTYRYFKKEEFDCKETNQNKMQHTFMQKLELLREQLGFPLRITSGFRSPEHSLEKAKAVPGAHTKGRAADIAVQGAQAYAVVAAAIKLGFRGIGVQQKGSVRFIHLDDLEHLPERPRPAIWSY
jgi:uncharacterized protein YcbK (DUF882 family)